MLTLKRLPYASCHQVNMSELSSDMVTNSVKDHSSHIGVISVLFRVDVCHMETSALPLPHGNLISML